MIRAVYSLVLLSLSIGLWGCASNSGLKDPGFEQRARSNTDMVPIPAEIAKDIEIITEDGDIFREVAPIAHKNLDEEPQDNTQDLKSNDASNLNQESVLTEEDLFLEKASGPLSKSAQRRSKGPLNFSNANASKGGGKTISYIVRLGDTLMKIAFEKHGNYLRWKEIYSINRHKMENPRKMHVGTELTIKNVKYVYIKKDGQPYLIRKNDTLKSISKKLYGTEEHWQLIAKNNPQLIRNPQKIYTGFTLYYQPSADQSIKQRQPTEASK